jgi:hypothetical protein
MSSSSVCVVVFVIAAGGVDEKQHEKEAQKGPFYRCLFAKLQQSLAGRSPRVIEHDATKPSSA